MKKVIFLTDFFVDSVLGGAELSTEVTIDYLTARGYTIQKVRCQDFNQNMLGEKLVITNFATLSEYNKNLITNNSNYIIIERDQKYVRTRNLTAYKNFIAPKSEIINREFYRNALSVLCLTDKHTELTTENLLLENIYNIGSTQFSEEQLKMIESNITEQKNGKYAIVNGKLDKFAVEYCEKNNVEYDHLPRMAYPELMKTLSKYTGIVFMSHHFESFCRLLVEAKILGLKIITDNRSGCTYEPWFKISQGKKMSNILRKNVKESIDIIDDKISELFGDNRDIIIRKIQNTKLLERKKWPDSFVVPGGIMSKCSVVGNSGKMLFSEDGKKIDFDSVIRFNDARTIGYEKHVGSKTDIRIMNCHYLLSIHDEKYYEHQKSRFPDIERYFAYTLENEIIIFKTDPSWELWKHQDIIKKIESKNNRVCFIGEDFYNLGKQYNNGKEPSNGMIGLMLAHKIYSEVDTYGFSFYDKQYKRHYYAEYEDVSSTTNHNWNAEKEFFGVLNEV